MDENKEMDSRELPEEEVFAPRPRWQVWGARVALVIFLILVALQLLQIAGGGL